jgi:hypothetical protein
MIPNVQVLERTKLIAPFGLQVWDIATSTHLVDGLDVQVMADTRFAARTQAFANRSGIYCAFGIPGLNRFELNTDDTANRKKQTRNYKIEVRDPAERFLPFTFDADLPTKGLFTGLTSRTSPPQLFVFPSGQGSLSVPLVQQVPLFSSPSRPVPDTLAVVRAELREIGAGRAAAWSLLTVSVDSVVRGIGLADQKGRVAILFPYPERPRPTLTSPPSATNDFHWNVELTAYYQPRPLNRAVPTIPDMADVLEQLNSPRTLFHSTLSPPQVLPPQALEYRVPLTVRTEITATGKSSFLFVNPA